MKGTRIQEKRRQIIVYLPEDLADNITFPFKETNSMLVKISFKIGKNKLVVEKWAENS